MTIVEALQNKEEFYGVRLSYNHRWLIWDDALNVWEVWEGKPHAKRTSRIYSGTDEQLAVAALTED